MLALPYMMNFIIIKKELTTIHIHIMAALN